MSDGEASDSHAGRTVEERIALAMPSSVVRIVLRAMIRLPPGSLLRRRMLKRAFARGLEAPSRGDYEFSLLFYEPDVETYIDSDFAGTLGYSETYHGHGGFVDAWRDIQEDVEDLHLVPEQIIDLGNRIAVRVNMVGRGRHSGIETAESQGWVYLFSRRGLIARQKLYRDWDEALAALKATE